jgi:hypothetical protein
VAEIDLPGWEISSLIYDLLINHDGRLQKNALGWSGVFGGIQMLLTRNYSTRDL